MSISSFHSLTLAAFVAVAAVCGAGAARGETLSAATASSTYRLGPGDKLRITTFGEPSLTGDFMVGDAGVLGFPLLGQVQAGGLTIAELQASLEAALHEGFLKEPRVSVAAISYRPYYILGEVTKPGEYPYSDSLTVMKAVAAAGGFTYRANTKRLHIKRASDDREVTAPLTATIPVHPGDTIRIGERYF